MTIVTLQYLRGVAALLVVVFHLETQTSRLGYHGYWPHWTFAGVDLFFVLSGFLMWAITARRKQNPGDFLLRRAARIVPLYWVITSVVVLVMLLAPQLMMTGRFIPGHVLGSYLFIGMPNSSGWLYPVLNVGWTLNIEMMFYLIFGVSLMLPSKFRAPAVATALALIVLSGNFFSPENIWAKQYTSSVIFEFVYGIMIAQLYQSGRLSSVRPLVAWLLIVSGFVAFTFAIPNGPLRGLFQGIPAAVVFVGFLTLDKVARKRPLPWLESLGNSSYSLYLTHLIVLSLIYQIWRKTGAESLPGGVWTFIVFAVLMCVMVAELVYRFMEVPITRMFQKKADGTDAKTAGVA